MYRLEALLDQRVYDAYALNASSRCMFASITSRNPRSVIMSKALFFHAGCPICISAEQQVAAALDPARYDVEVVHLGEQKSRIAEAEGFGVQSVPALVIDGQPFHINFGASLADLK